MKRIILILLFVALGASAQNRYEEVLTLREGEVPVTVNGTGGWLPLDLTLYEGDGATLERVAVGENLFLPTVRLHDGALGQDAFKGAVITLDTERGTLTVSSPYKPSYMPLASRAELSETLPRLKELLEKGVVTLDFPRGKSYFLAHADKPAEVLSQAGPKSVIEGAVTHLTTADFLAEVHDFRAGTEWKYKGTVPCVVDFWATWCAPCRRLSPAVDALAEEYEGRVKFYKVDVDKEPDVAEYFNVTAIPVIVFIPVEGAPRPVMVTSPEQIRENLEGLFL